MHHTDIKLYYTYFVIKKYNYLLINCMYNNNIIY